MKSGKQRAKHTSKKIGQKQKSYAGAAATGAGSGDQGGPARTQLGIPRHIATKGTSPSVGSWDKLPRQWTRLSEVEIYNPPKIRRAFIMSV